jgi:hypothetical protein
MTMGRRSTWSRDLTVGNDAEGKGGENFPAGTKQDRMKCETELPFHGCILLSISRMRP